MEASKLSHDELLSSFTCSFQLASLRPGAADLNDDGEIDRQEFAIIMDFYEAGFGDKLCCVTLSVYLGSSNEFRSPCHASCSHRTSVIIENKHSNTDRSMDVCSD